MAFDALSAGIEPGGLRDITEIRLLVCYLLKTVDRPVSAEDISDIFLEDGLVNYFETGDALSELVKSGSLTAAEQDGRMMYTVTETGKKIADLLYTGLPLTVRERTAAIALRWLSRRKSEKENKVTIEPADHGFTVTLAVLDGERELMSVRVPVTDRNQADLVKNNFYDDPATIYCATVALLTGDIRMLLDYLNTKY